MTYNTLTDQEKERINAVDVLGWAEKTFDVRCDKCNTHSIEQVSWVDNSGCPRYKISSEAFMDNTVFHPLTDLNHAMLGVEKLSKKNKRYLVLEDFTHRDERKWQANLYSTNGYSFGNGHTPQEAIVEACIRIKRPDLFEGE